MNKKSIPIAMICLCFLFWGCGGGSGGDGGGSDNVPNETRDEHGTGNQDFTIGNLENNDPLNGYRINEEGDGSNTLPSSIDHSDLLPEVRSQGHTSSCTSWAIGYYGKTFQEVREERWDPNENAFSPAYLYAMQCRTYERPWDIVNAWEILNRNGIAKWSSLPFEDLSSQENGNEISNYANLAIPQAVQEEARIYRCGELARMKNMTEVKQALTKGPVVLGINWWAPPPANPSPEENYMRYDPQHNNVGHAILCVGYDDSKFGDGAYKFVNSWGPGWGENGFSWIRYKDFLDVCAAAITYEDIPNPVNPDDSDNTRNRPAQPSDVSASDGAGNFVEITWSPVPGARYYRIYRTEVGKPAETYAGIGVAYQGNYRDYPSPGVSYYYSVAAVNDLGESEHFASDTDEAGYVDKGSANGDALGIPTLHWEYNDAEISHFTVGNIDPAATTMEVLVATASEGPWDSLGWIKPDNFDLKWGEDSKYGNKKPFVRVRVANAEGSSGLCEPVQVGDTIDNNVEVSKINVYVVTPKTNSILLRWMTDGGKVDLFEIWRYCAGNDEADDWVKIGYSDPGVKDKDNFIFFEDLTLLPGLPYYYVVVPVYQGAYGELAYLDSTFKIIDQGANLHLTSIKYYYSQITTPTNFPEIVVRNDGSTRVNGYTVGILAYDWSERKAYLVAKMTRNVSLEPGNTDIFAINHVNIHSDFADGHVYSWGLMVDYDNEISETYEDDNLLWSNEGWWLEADGRAGADARAAGGERGPRIGSSRPFSNRNQVEEPGERSMERATSGDDQVTIYHGPSIFHRPDFCNDHSE